MATFSMSDPRFITAIARAEAANAAREARFGLRPGNVQVGDLLIFPTPKRGVGRHAQLEWVWLGAVGQGHLLVPLDERWGLAHPLDIILSEDEAPFGAVARTDQAIMIGQALFNQGQRIWHLPVTTADKIRERMSALVTGKKFPISTTQRQNEGDAEAEEAALEVEACRLYLEKLDAKAR